MDSIADPATTAADVAKAEPVTDIVPPPPPATDAPAAPAEGEEAGEPEPAGLLAEENPIAAALKTSGPLKCGICHEVIVGTLQNHKQLKHQSRVHLTNWRDVVRNKDGFFQCPCDECGVQYSHPASLQYHWKTKHRDRSIQKNAASNADGTPDLSFKCDACGQSFSSHYRLKDHRQRAHQMKVILRGGPRTNGEGAGPLTIHRIDNVFKCPQCATLYEHPLSFQKHWTRKHKATPLTGSGVPGIKCEICGETFSTRGKLEHHKQREHQKKMTLADGSIILRDTSGQFKCPMCSTRYKDPRSLHVHWKSKHRSAVESELAAAAPLVVDDAKRPLTEISAPVLNATVAAAVAAAVAPPSKKRKIDNEVTLSAAVVAPSTHESV